MILSLITGMAASMTIYGIGCSIIRARHDHRNAHMDEHAVLFSPRQLLGLSINDHPEQDGAQITGAGSSDVFLHNGAE